jgi:hypothetical protein
MSSAFAATLPPGWQQRSSRQVDQVESSRPPLMRSVPQGCGTPGRACGKPSFAHGGVVSSRYPDWAGRRRERAPTVPRPRLVTHSREFSPPGVGRGKARRCAPSNLSACCARPITRRSLRAGAPNARARQVAGRPMGLRRSAEAHSQNHTWMVASPERTGEVHALIHEPSKTPSRAAGRG